MREIRNGSPLEMSWQIDTSAAELTVGDMPPDELRVHLDRVSDWVVAYNKQLDADPGAQDGLPVTPQIEPGRVRQALPPEGPEVGCSMNDILDQFESIVAPALTHGSHPAFYGYFTATASGPSVLAETLGAALNVNTMLWKTGPGANELEEASLSWLRNWLGLPAEFWGTITEGGSFSNLQGLAAARAFKLGSSFQEVGLANTDSGGLLRIYVSELTHSSVDKAAMLLGLGRQSLRRVPVDAAFRMKPEVLEEMIFADRAAGLKPFCIVATIGTTACTSVDPIAILADIAEAEKLWLHVDAAHGGPLAMLSEARFMFKGWERAHSIALNPHKWLFVPIGCSILYTRYPAALRESFSFVADYLETKDEVDNAMDYGIALGRRFNALKLAFTLQYFGLQGYRSRFREHVRLAREFAAWIAADDHFELAAPVPMSTVCFRAIPSSNFEKEVDAFNEELMQTVNASGQAFLSPARLNGNVVLRLVVSGIRVREKDIQAVWRLLRSVRADLARATERSDVESN